MTSIKSLACAGVLACLLAGGRSAPRADAAPCCCGPDTCFEIMFVYTARALASGGGGDIERLRARVDLGLEAADKILADSRVPVVLRSVGLVPTGVSEYTDLKAKTLKDFPTILDDVSGDRAVLDLRMRLRADLVCVLVEAASSGGSGYARQWSDPREDFAPRAYCGVYASDIWKGQLMHEVAHLCGCGHQRGGEVADPLYGWSFAHTFAVEGQHYCTLLAEASAETQCFGAGRLAYLSNPRVSHPVQLSDGSTRTVPLGVCCRADNAGTIARNRHRIARWGERIGAPRADARRGPGY